MWNHTFVYIFRYLSPAKLVKAIGPLTLCGVKWGVPPRMAKYAILTDSAQVP